MPPIIAGEPESFLIKAGRLVYDFIKIRQALGEPLPFSVNDLDVIWFTKAHDDWRILFRTPVEDGIFYRVTNDPHRHEVRIDAFQQFDNLVLPNQELR